MTTNYFMADLIEETLSMKMDFDWNNISLYVSLQKHQALLNEVCSIRGLKKSTSSL